MLLNFLQLQLVEMMSPVLSAVFSVVNMVLSACVMVENLILNVAVPNDFTTANGEDYKQVIKTLTLNVFNTLSCYPT